MNLLMLAQLRDINGKIRYTLGAQIDVSSLVPDSTDLDGAASGTAPQLGFVSTTATTEKAANRKEGSADSGEMLDVQDRHKIQKWRARTMQEQLDDDVQSTNSSEWRRPGILLRDPSSDSLPETDFGGWVNSRLSGFYQNVSFHPSVKSLLLNLVVSSRSTLPVFTCSFCFSIFANTRDAPVTRHGQDRG